MKPRVVYNCFFVESHQGEAFWRDGECVFFSQKRRGKIRKGSVLENAVNIQVIIINKKRMQHLFLSQWEKSRESPKKKEKIQEKEQKKGVSQCLGAALKCWLTPKCWSTSGQNMCTLMGSGIIPMIH